MSTINDPVGTGGSGAGDGRSTGGSGAGGRSVPGAHSDAAYADAADAYADLEFCEVVDCYGMHLGLLEQLYLDAETLRPTWAQVIGGLGYMHRMLVPLPWQTLEDVTKKKANGAVPMRLRLEVSAAHAGEAPILDATDGISAAEDAQLRAHYGMEPRKSSRRASSKRG